MAAKLPNKRQRRDSSEDESFTARDYQLEILEIAKKQNTIACLGTGTGKTFIAVMLIRENAAEVRKPYKSGGKRIFFLVPTVPLVTQQEKTISLHTDLKVRGYFGEMDVDSWKKDQWVKEFETYEVLVMTAEIFRIILHHTFISLKDIQLIIFDECHRAQGDSPYCQAMKYISDQDPKVIPRIFGLSASLLNGKIKPNKLEKYLRELEVTLRCSITTASDISDIQKYGTDPDEYVVMYSASQSPECEELLELLNNEIFVLAQKQPPTGVKFVDTDDDLFSDETDIVFFNKSKNCLQQLQYVLCDLGIWCAHNACVVFLNEIEALCARPFDSEYKQILLELRRFLVNFKKLCEKRDLTLNVQTLSKSPHKLQRLMELFYQIKVSDKYKNVSNEMNFPEDLTFHNNPEQFHKKMRHLESLKQASTIPICSIIFVEKRITAYALYKWILEISNNIPGFGFLKPAFLVGHGASAVKSGARDTIMSVKKQNKILADFRDKKVNILIATSVLEEGMDIQQCNVVIRFDPPLDFRSYVQSKGRARAKDSIYVIFIDHQNDLKFLEDMCNFKVIEQMMVSKCHNRDVPEDEDIGMFLANEIISPYTPYGRDGPRISSTSSISLINRYCAKLPCDMSTKLVPKWNVTVVDPDAKAKKFKCILKMPINSPLRKTIESDEMPRVRLSKMSAALKACQLLHEMGELNEDLIPISCLVDQALESELGEQMEEICAPGIQPGTKRRRQIYNKKVPIFLSNVKPVAQTPCFLHILVTDLLVPLPASLNPRGRRLTDPSKSTRGFGLLLTKKLPKICNFPIFTKSGKVLIKVQMEETALYLSEEEVEAVEDFHKFLFNNVFYYGKDKSFAPDCAVSSCIIVPVNISDNKAFEIDWSFMKMTKEHDFNKQRHDIKKLKKTVFSENLFKDAVVLKSYKAELWETESPTFHYVQKIIYDKTPLTQFDSYNYTTFKGYYKEKYNADVSCDDQPLIEATTCGTLSMWKPLYTKIDQNYDNISALSKNKLRRMKHREELIPELCLVHPFPLQMFEKALYLPTILFRINSLLLAEELRQKVAISAHVGKVNLKPGFQWPNFRLETSDKELTRLLISKGTLPDEEENFRIVPRDIVISGSRIVSFNAKVDDEQNYGPSPSVILQALTAKSTGDEFDLERYEVIGDSFLKYTMSIKIYLKYTLFDEGKLTQLRMKLIRNFYLYQCAKKKNLAEYIICTCFDGNMTWLPPCYEVEEYVDPNLVIKSHDGSDDTPTRFLFFKHHLMSDKCVADCVEALIGAYLLSCGQQGALRFMFWLGLNPLPITVEHPSMQDFENWLPDPPDPIVNRFVGFEQQFAKLTSGFENFEREIKYTFKNKAYLLQAFTHPSYSYNEITDCYQRLEFIGDAILDYLVTRQLYENPRNHSPGELTDLRSALVNNIYFASLAIKHGFNKFLLMSSPTLFKLVKQYVEILQGSDSFSFFMENSFYLEEIECFELEEVEVPKALGDLVESVAGAIYFDSGMSLDAVWKVYEPLMKPAMDHYCSQVPKSPVRELYELLGAAVNSKTLFKDIVVKEDKTYVKVNLPDGRQFSGVGPNKKIAKKSAAKRAIFELKKDMDQS